MPAWERENAMYLPIDFYPTTLAMGHLALSLSPSTSYRISLQRGRRDIDGKGLTSSIGNAHHFGAYGIRYDALHRQFHNVISSVETDLCGEPIHNAYSTVNIGGKFRVEAQTLFFPYSMDRLTWTSLSNDGLIRIAIVRWSTPWVSQSHFNSGASSSIHNQGFGQQTNSHMPSITLACVIRTAILL